ncbi:hypothetical protein J6Z19_06500 [bacterium]|nr:hypothetical protein [bacterium]
MKEMIEMICSNALANIVSDLVVASIIWLIVKGYVSKFRFTKKMESLGFLSSSIKMQSSCEVEDMCKEAKEIKIINVSGVRYLTEYKEYYKEALNRGTKIKILCCDPKSVFLSDLEEMERYMHEDWREPSREKKEAISAEIRRVVELYKDTPIEIRFFSTQYRLPCVIARYKDESVKTWLTVALSPYSSSKLNPKLFTLRGEKKADRFYDEDNFVDMMETHFDTIWNYGSKQIPLNSFEEYVACLRKPDI